MQCLDNQTGPVSGNPDETRLKLKPPPRSILKCTPLVRSIRAQGRVTGIQESSIAPDRTHPEHTRVTPGCLLLNATSRFSMGPTEAKPLTEMSTGMTILSQCVAICHRVAAGKYSDIK